MGPTVRFENFTVQLKSLDVDRYAHMAIEIEVADEVAKGMVEKKVPPIRDAILSYLSDRTPDELRGSDGLQGDQGVDDQEARRADPRPSHPQSLHHRFHHPVTRTPDPHRELHPT